MSIQAFAGSWASLPTPLTEWVYVRPFSLGITINQVQGRCDTRDGPYSNDTGPGIDNTALHEPQRRRGRGGDWLRKNAGLSDPDT